MRQYLDLIKDVLENGSVKSDRTGTGTTSIFGCQFRHDLAKGFPLLTTKKLKQKHPDVKIGNAFSLHGVINKNLEHIVEKLDLGDFVAFTYFPVDVLNEINKNPAEARADLEKIFEIVPNNNVAIFEISWSTDDFVGGNSTNQQNFMKTVFD